MRMSSNRYDSYRSITARKAAKGACGHPIVAGDRVGWHRLHGAQCEQCWMRWSDENQEADRMEGCGSW